MITMTGHSDHKIATSGKSISRAVDILGCVGNGINSVTAIAENCKLSKATVHRLLNVLIENHLIRKDPISRQYFLGHFITQLLSKPQVTHEYLIRCASEDMVHLASVTQETINLDILSGFSDVLVKSIPSKHTLRIVEENTIIDPLHAGACGKVLLAQLDNKELKTALKYIKLESLTENTITHKEELALQIKRSREQGYTISYGERFSGVICICTPIYNYTVPAALSAIGPEARVKPRIAEILDELKKSSAAISEKIKVTLQTSRVN